MAYNETNGFCTDRVGLIDPETFMYHACSMCYMYLFQNTKILTYNQYTLSLMPADGSNPGMRPDLSDPNTVEYVCQTLNDDECEGWKACCMDGVACCASQLANTKATPEGYCPRTWDGYGCWDDTKNGTSATQSCPSFIPYSSASKFAVKTCLDNGTWYSQDGEKEWTDYTACNDRDRHFMGVYVTVGLSIASIALLLPAIVILSAFSNLRKQHRIRLHIHFFIALMLCALAFILWFTLVHYDLVSLSLNKIIDNNPVWCRVLSFFKIYLTSATYMWMFCEGYYLHRLISRAFEPPKSLIPLYALGWGLPLIPAIIYAIIRGIFSNGRCWAYNYGPVQWIIYTPNLICLLTNLVFLCNILRILLFKLHSHPHEPNSFRRGLKAVFMLIPLFGLQLFLTIYRPPAGAPGERGYELFQFIVGSSQGIFVSLIFCFFNGEVINQLSSSFGCLTFCPFARSSKQRRFSVQMTQVTSADDFRTPNASILSPSISNGSSPGKKPSEPNGETDQMIAPDEPVCNDISQDITQDIQIEVPQQKGSQGNGPNSKKVKYAKLNTIVDI